jgi:hypothetical protein
MYMIYRSIRRIGRMSLSYTGDQPVAPTYFRDSASLREIVLKHFNGLVGDGEIGEVLLDPGLHAGQVLL